MSSSSSHKSYLVASRTDHALQIMNGQQADADAFDDSRRGSFPSATDSDAPRQVAHPPLHAESSGSPESRTKGAVARTREDDDIALPHSTISTSAPSMSSVVPPMVNMPQVHVSLQQHPPHPGQTDDISLPSSRVCSPEAAPRRIPLPSIAAPDRAQIPITSGHFSMQGVRPEMEDRVTMLQHPDFNRLANFAEDDGQSRSFFAVFDGHGGDVSAEYCRQHVHNNLLLSEAFQAGQLAEGLKAALVKTEDDFCSACRRINLLTSSGTTAITAFIQADQLVVGNVGDSRAVICRAGRAVDASIDHKPGRKEERTRIESLGGRVGITEEDAFRTTQRPCPCLWACVSAGRPLRVFPGGLSVSRTIGDISMKHAGGSGGGGIGGGNLVSSEPEMFECQLTPSDEFLLLACDGTWDVMSSSQAVDFVRGVLFRSNNDPEVAAKALANEAFRRGSTDNISVVCVVFGVPDRQKQGRK